jgi:hypothetical protein
MVFKGGKTFSRSRGFFCKAEAREAGNVVLSVYNVDLRDSQLKMPLNCLVALI